MAKDPAFLFYPNDWLGGTMGMTFEDKGAYMELLMMQFNRGHMTTHMIGQAVGHLWVNVKDKFIQDADGLWYNDRLEVEQEKRRKYTESRNNNKTGTNQHTKNGAHMTTRMTGHMENENENVNTDIIRIKKEAKTLNFSFGEFWELYDKKVGDKTKLTKKWEALTDDERSAAIYHIPLYKVAQPDKKYRKDPATYLNNKSFNDEIIQDGTNTNKSGNGAGSIRKISSIEAIKQWGSDIITNSQGSAANF